VYHRGSTHSQKKTHATHTHAHTYTSSLNLFRFQNCSSCEQQQCECEWAHARYGIERGHPHRGHDQRADRRARHAAYGAGCQPRRQHGHHHGKGVCKGEFQVTLRATQHGRPLLPLCLPASLPAHLPDCLHACPHFFALPVAYVLCSLSRAAF
jgi:hypothetical protein